MKDVAGKVAIVTGGASGMGRIIALRLVNRGAKVAIFDVNEQGLQATAAESPQITPLRCDIGDLADVEAKVGQVESELGPVELLVHAAALMPAHQLIDHSHEAMERLFRINYFGTTYMVRTVLAPMMARKRGRIIAFGSIAGHALVPHMGAYCATKSAVNTYLEVLQNEIRGSGVKVQLVCPPAVNTPLIDQSLNTDSPGSLRNAKQSGRLSDPEKIVDAIDKGVEKERDIIYPGEARFLMLWHAFAPRLWWKTVLGFEK
ncbi:SDR family NAD(P)-dependent oxidoreductase [Parahaliea mediterranea]|uniref:SDR family NAD(P)-dependent oxidoreductase n=1 Tax=Parahaliea mediterranea TaxID=651086 RepID=UPI0013009153|nr:SDR family oxidoreductase [Parahaliea mediterranea]